MGFRDLLTSDNQDWMMPDPSINIKVMSANEYGQSLPTLVPDGDGGMKYADNPSYGQYLDSLPDSLKKTKEYTAYKAQDLADNIFGSFTANNSVLAGGNNVGDWTQQLENIKQSDPNAYYNAVLSLDLRKAGWDAGQGKTNNITNARIQSNLQDAAKAGAINADQYNNLVANNYSNTASWHANNIAARAGDGATLGGLPQFAATAAALGVGLGGLIGAFAPAALANLAYSVVNAAQPNITSVGTLPINTLHIGGGTNEIR
jgi:hypothetical protein